MKELVLLYLQKSLKPPFKTLKSYYYDYKGFSLYSNSEEHILFLTESEKSQPSINFDIINRVSGMFGISQKDSEGFVVEYLNETLKGNEDLKTKIKSLVQPREILILYNERTRV